MSKKFYDKQELLNTPSYRNGIEHSVEARYRFEGVTFISGLCGKLGLDYMASATGANYFHKFYMVHSFADFNRYVVATACTFLAGKAVETPKKCDVLLQEAAKILSQEQYREFGDNPKDEILAIERLLLHAIHLDFEVEQPFSCILSYAKDLQATTKRDIDEIVQAAWTLCNDSLSTTLCLEWEPEIIAISLIYLACKMLQCEVALCQKKKLLQSADPWWNHYVENLPTETIEDICHRILDIYSRTQIWKEEKKACQSGQVAVDEETANGNGQDDVKASAKKSKKKRSAQGSEFTESFYLMDESTAKTLLDTRRALSSETAARNTKGDRIHGDSPAPCQSVSVVKLPPSSISSFADSLSACGSLSAAAQSSQPQTTLQPSEKTSMFNLMLPPPPIPPLLSRMLPPHELVQTPHRVESQYNCCIQAPPGGLGIMQHNLSVPPPSPGQIVPSPNVPPPPVFVQLHGPYVPFPSVNVPPPTAALCVRAPPPVSPVGQPMFHQTSPSLSVGLRGTQVSAPHDQTPANAALKTQQYLPMTPPFRLIPPRPPQMPLEHSLNAPPSPVTPSWPQLTPSHILQIPPYNPHMPPPPAATLPLQQPLLLPQGIPDTANGPPAAHIQLHSQAVGATRPDHHVQSTAWH